MMSMDSILFLKFTYNYYQGKYFSVGVYTVFLLLCDFFILCKGFRDDPFIGCVSSNPCLFHPDSILVDN